MTLSEPVRLLPTPNPAEPPLEPIDHLLSALEHITKTFRGIARDPERQEPLYKNADERREQLYNTAAANLAATYLEAEQAAVYDRHVARYGQLNPAQQRVATLALHGLACDRASGTRGRDGHTWSAAAIAALELYRADRTLSRISRH